MELRSRIPALLAATVIQIALAVGGTPLVSANVDGSADNLSMALHNDRLASGDDIVSIMVYGGTAEDFPILWDCAGFPIGPAGADIQIVGENTQALTISFADDPDGFSVGEIFTLEGMDPAGVTPASAGEAPACSSYTHTPRAAVASSTSPPDLRNAIRC